MGIFIVVHVVSVQAVSLCLGWLKFKANPDHPAQGPQSWSVKHHACSQILIWGQASVALVALCHHKQLLAPAVPHSA